MQFRWTALLAAADEQREREHLNSEAELFASEFNLVISSAAQFLQNNSWTARESKQPLGPLPKVLAEVYFLDLRGDVPVRMDRLGDDGLFSRTETPNGLVGAQCIGSAVLEKPTLVALAYDVKSVEQPSPAGPRRLKTVRLRDDRCMVGRIDMAYLVETLFPKLIQRSFGATVTQDYEFEVSTVSSTGTVIFGPQVRPDIQKRFFSIPPPVLYAPQSASDGKTTRAPRVEAFIKGQAARPSAVTSPSGIWELNIARKGAPLATVFAERRHRELWASFGVEGLLVTMSVLLVMGAHRSEKLAREKMRFVAGVSHELRTPVSAISMLSRNQADGLVSTAERVKQYGELIHHQSRRLNEMIEETLQYAGIQSGLRPQARKEIDLGALVGESVKALREDPSWEGVEIETSISSDLPSILGDADLLRIAIDNLLSNAHKHASCGHWVRVSANYWPANQEIGIVVEDRGPGIDPSEQTEIFGAFWRGSVATEMQIPGSGLGLSLVKGAAEAHRGTVTLTSELGHGSEFTIHLPV